MRVALLALSLLALASGALLRPRHHIQPSTRRTSSAAPVLTAAVDVRDDQGETALVRAAEAGEEDQVRSLLASGADATLASFSGWTAVHGAAECGSVAVLTMLAEAGADLSARASSGKTPLDIARQYKQPAAASLLLASAGGNQLARYVVCAPMHEGSMRASRVHAIRAEGRVPCGKADEPPRWEARGATPRSCIRSRASIGCPREPLAAAGLSSRRASAHVGGGQG